MTKAPLEAGFAAREYIAAPGLPLQGQFFERRALDTRDPLLAIAGALRQGELVVVVASLDLCLLSEPFIRACQQQFARAHGRPPASLLLHATHTHVAPAINSEIFGKNEADPAFVEQVQARLLEAVAAALADLEPVTIHAGSEPMAQMGWNRRAMFSDGTTRMYGHSGMPGFVGMEGPRDPELGVLFFRNDSGKVKGAVLNFSSHPNCLESARRVSADFPGEARRLVSQELGGVPVLYLTGAAGDTSPSLLDPVDLTQSWRGEEGLIRSGRYLADTALHAMAAAGAGMEAPRLALAQSVLPVALRPWPRPDEAAYPNPADPVMERVYRDCEARWPELLASRNPTLVRLSVVRLGNAVLCTNPAELFVEFGLEIKRRSPAKLTLVAELTDGYNGYVPTRRALARGGYEAWPTVDSRLEAGAGEQIVEETGRLLAQIGL